jgi:FkbM family methyltransferase
MSVERNIQDYECIFEALLGRSLNEVEKVAVKNRHGDILDRASFINLIREVAQSDEFFFRFREGFARRLFPEPCVVVAKTPLGDEVLADLRQFHLGFAIATGHFEPSETAFVQRYVRRGNRVLDVGANIGYFTTIFARLVGNAGTVHAFEPVGETFRKLDWAIRRNGIEHIVHAQQLALSNSEGEAEIVFEPASVNVGAARLGSHVECDAKLCCERVRTRQIDDLIGAAPIDFIKIDVEGAEWLVIQGGQKLFQDQNPLVMIEFNAPQLQSVSGVTADFLMSRLLGFGYHPYEIMVGGNVRPLKEPDGELEVALARTGIVNLAFAKNGL